MVFLSDNGLASGWGTVLCRDTACIMIKPLFAWLLLCASLCIVQIKNSLRPGQSWLWSLRLSAPPQPKSSVPFYVPTSSLFVSLPEVFGHHSPSVSLSHSLSLPFYSFSDGRVFHPWCVLNDSPSVWQWFDMSRCYINPLSSRMLKGGKQDKEEAPVSRSNTPPPHTFTKPIPLWSRTDMSERARPTLHNKEGGAREQIIPTVSSSISLSTLHIRVPTLSCSLLLIISVKQQWWRIMSPLPPP